MKFILRLAVLVFAVIFVTSCGEENPLTKDGKKDERLKVVSTTSIVRDAVDHIAGDRVRSESLMGSGVDPHLYKASQGDVRKLREADVIFYNGVHLEGKMVEILEKLGREKPVYAASDAFDKDRLIRNSEFSDGRDPHFWFDLDLWSESVGYIAGKLIEHDPDNEELYEKNAAEYQRELAELDEWIAEATAELDSNERIVITSHDALSYYARKYDFSVRGLQGSSTAAEFGLKDVSNMVDFIIENEIKAIFPENIVSSQALEAVIKGCERKGHHVTLGGSLYSDALGQDGTHEGEYTGMVRANTRTLIENLK